MAEETLKTTAAAEAPAAAAEVAVAPEKVEETVAVEVSEQDAPVEALAEAETEVKAVEEEKEKISESASFKEESNVAGELPDPQKKALDELKQLVQEALNKHEFTAVPKPVKEEKKPAEEEKKPAEEEKKPAEEEKKPATEEEKKPATEEEKNPAMEEEKKPAEEEKTATVVEEEAKVCDETAGKDESTPAAAEPSVTAVESSEPVAEPVKEVTEVIKKTETCVDEDGAKKIEAVQETIVAATASTELEKTDETEQLPAVEETPVAPEEVSIWGIPLLADERSDVVLLKFLRARDFKVKEAFTMLKNVVAWRKEFGIDSLLEEDLGTEQEKVVYMHGVDKEGHPVCYNAYSEYQNKELYNETFSTEEKRTKYLRWRIQFLEKSIRKLDFSPDGICTILQVFDFRNSPGPFKWELRQATNQAFQLFQDNYPEFVAKQVLLY